MQQDILKDAQENQLNSAADMPYFEGDFWPNVLEESIKELDQEEEEKRKREEAEAAATEEADMNGDGVEGTDLVCVSISSILDAVIGAAILLGILYNTTGLYQYHLICTDGVLKVIS